MCVCVCVCIHVVHCSCVMVRDILQPFIDLSARPVYKSVVSCNTLSENSCHIKIFLGNVKKMFIGECCVCRCRQSLWILIIFAMRNYE